VPEPLCDLAGAPAELSVGCAVLVPFGHRDAVGFVMALEEGEGPSFGAEPAAAEAKTAAAEAAEPAAADEPSARQSGEPLMLELFPEEHPSSAEVSAARTSASKRKPHASAAKSRLKPIKQVLTTPYFDEVGAECARFLAKRYIAPLSSCVRLFTPPGGIPKVKLIDHRWQVLMPVTHEVDDRWVVLCSAADDFVPRSNAVKQIAVMEALASGDLRVAELAAEYGNVSSTLRALEEKGVLFQSSKNRKSGLYAAREVLDEFTLYERSLATPLGDTRAERPSRRVPQRP
jgi:primosomal protein N'